MKPNTEIERKFLVKVDQLPKQAKTGGTKFLQGYLSLEPVVRVRASTQVAWITIKGPTTGISKPEFEYQIPVQDAWGMLELCQHKLTKTRRKLLVGEHTWEVDEFHGALSGLWLAEVELAREDEEFVTPEWLGNEVSFDSRYSNSSLSFNQTIPG